MSIELSELYSTFFRGCVLGAGFWGFRRGVLRVKSGRRRGANGRFCRGIPGFLDWRRVRHGDSAHGGHCRASLAKKFLKRGEKPKNWGARDAGRWSRSTFRRVCGAIFEPGGWTSSSVARGALRAGTSTTGAHHEISEFCSSYI